MARPEPKPEPRPEPPRPDAFYAPFLGLPFYHGLLPRADVAELLVRQGDFLLRFAEADSSGRMKPVLSVSPGPAVKEKAREEVSAPPGARNPHEATQKWTSTSQFTRRS